jgi:hypothetical protein
MRTNLHNPQKNISPSLALRQQQFGPHIVPGSALTPRTSIIGSRSASTIKYSNALQFPNKGAFAAVGSVETPLKTRESMTVALSPFASRKPRSFAERKATLVFGAKGDTCFRSERRHLFPGRSSNIASERPAIVSNRVRTAHTEVRHDRGG